jgi:hypothetical protein
MCKGFGHCGALVEESEIDAVRGITGVKKRSANFVSPIGTHTHVPFEQYLIDTPLSRDDHHPPPIMAILIFHFHYIFFSGKSAQGYP